MSQLQSQDADARVGAAISDAMVALIREAVGRGPKRARTFIHEDVILCLLEETMTPLERTLHEQGRDDAVGDIREVLHDAMGPKAARQVEALTGRTVTATLADHHRGPDAGVLVFLLESRRGAVAVGAAPATTSTSPASEAAVSGSSSGTAP
jgi:uncharacterized protein YbcI